MAEQQPSGDMSWVFDSLVDFLRGSIWNIPVLNFIENRSMVFEPNGEEREYRRIHNDYKNLVDFMLGTYMEDIGITSAQFEAACSKSSGKIKTKFHQILFEQLWAADDFQLFCRMMVRTNIELQLQALELLQQRYGVTPDIFRAAATEISEEEKRVLEEVIRKSMEEHEVERQRLDSESRAIERVLADSADEKRRLELERRQEQELIQATMRLNLEPDPAGSASATPPTDQSSAAASSSADPAQTKDSEPVQISPGDIARRQQYLRAQRDKLLAMKRTERAKLLEEPDQEVVNKRPKSSRAARSAFAGQVDTKTLEMRKHLAAAIRREVVNKK